MCKCWFLGNKMTEENRLYTPDQLPNNMIGLDTVDGQALRNQSNIKNDLMIDRYVPQHHNSYCGYASLALVINAINVAYRIKYIAVEKGSSDEAKLNDEMSHGSVSVNENDVADSPSTRSFKPPEVDAHGMTLEQLATVSSALGFGVNTYFAVNDSMPLSDHNKAALF